MWHNPQSGCRGNVIFLAKRAFWGKGTDNMEESGAESLAVACWIDQSDTVKTSRLFSAMKWRPQCLCRTWFGQDQSVTVEFFSDFTPHLNQETMVLSRNNQFLQTPPANLLNKKKSMAPWFNLQTTDYSKLGELGRRDDLDSKGISVCPPLLAPNLFALGFS